MASKNFRVSGQVLADIQAIAKAGDISEADLVRGLVVIGLERLQLRINQRNINGGVDEQTDHA